MTWFRWPKRDISWRYPIIGSIICAMLFYGTYLNNQNYDRMCAAIHQQQELLKTIHQQQQVIQELSNRKEHISKNDRYNEQLRLKTAELINSDKLHWYAIESNSIKYNKSQFGCLARNIFFEAGTEDMMGKISVAQVTQNRINLGYWGRNMCNVIYSPSQFSWTLTKHGSPWGPHWEESKQAAHMFLDQGVRIKPLAQALFYHADYVKPEWADRHLQLAQIGRHIFYRGARGFDPQLMSGR